jgi:hypothetical protein
MIGKVLAVDGPLRGQIIDWPLCTHGSLPQLVRFSLSALAAER